MINKNFTKAFFILIFLITPTLLWSQDENEYQLPSDIYISPDFGLVVGNITSIEIAPAVGYHISPRLSLGLGGRYEFFRQLDPFTRDELINTHIWGIKSFSRLMIIPQLEEILPLGVPMGLFAHAEVEFLNLENKYYSIHPSSDEGRFWNTAVLAGGGISQQASKRTFVNIMILWDLTNTRSSPYINPVIRFGMQIYL